MKLEEVLKIVLDKNFDLKFENEEDCYKIYRNKRYDRYIGIFETNYYYLIDVLNTNTHWKIDKTFKEEIQEYKKYYCKKIKEFIEFTCGNSFIITDRR